MLALPGLTSSGILRNRASFPALRQMRPRAPAPAAPGHARRPQPRAGAPPASQPSWTAAHSSLCQPCRPHAGLTSRRFMRTALSLTLCSVLSSLSPAVAQREWLPLLPETLGGTCLQQRPLRCQSMHKFATSMLSSHRRRGEPRPGALAGGRPCGHQEGAFVCVVWSGPRGPRQRRTRRCMHLAPEGTSPDPPCGGVPPPRKPRGPLIRGDSAAT